ncbi:hypothetical protein ABHI18_011092, partial [Aspergillus niger]
MPRVLSKDVGPVGYGLASLTIPPKIPPEAQALECLRAAADADCLVWNAGEFYGTPTYNSLVLLGHFFAKYPEYADKVLLNVKGALLPAMAPCGDPEHIRKSVGTCLAQLGGHGQIDMYEMARIDPNVPLRVQLNTLKSLVLEGKIGSVALTEVNAETIREAASIVDISSVEIELSLFCTDPLHNGILTTCAELRIPVMAYCPVGRGFLSGKLQSHDDIPEGDYRRMLPKYRPENLEVNLKLVKEVQKMADRKGVTTSQIALGWLLGLSNREDMPTIIPIPGSASEQHIRENAAAVPLSKEEMEAVDAILAQNPIVGERYHAHGMKFIN